MWLIIIFLLLCSEHTIVQANYTFTFSSQKGAKKNQDAILAAKILHNSQTFQKQLYEQGISQENEKLQQIYYKLLQQQAIKENESTIQIAQEIPQSSNSFLRKPEPQKTVHASVTLHDLEKHSVKQLQKESQTLEVVIEEYKHSDVREDNIIYEKITLRQKRRLVALQDTVADSRRFREKYDLNETLKHYTQEKNIESSLLTHCNGTYIQQDFSKYIKKHDWHLTSSKKFGSILE